MTVTLVHRTDGAEALTAYMARVSNPKNQNNLETAPQLLRYLIEHQHWSPFEMCSMCVNIETQRDIAAQLIRHRSFSFQEFSTRYARTSIAETPALRRQDTANRQNSIDDFLPEEVSVMDSLTGRVISDAYGAYYELLERGVAKECARRVLPLCTPTTLYMHGTLRSWIHYIHIRTGVETQKEHRDIAVKCKEIFCHCFPVIGEVAFTEPFAETLINHTTT